MKNIHLIPTDKPSRLSILYSGKLNFGAEIMSSQNSNPQHIYVTTDDKNIKEGDWFLTKVGDVVLKVQKPERGYTPIGKKIILTTDQDLINDGVQAIDDDFLEWFVKNQSCEVVEIEKTFVTNSGLGYQEYAVLDSNFKVIEINTKIPQTSYYLGKVTILNSYEYVISYKIIIPQEEPKCTCIEHDPYCCQIHGGCPLCVKPETLEDTVLGHKTSLIAQMLDSKEIPEEPKQTYSEKQVKAAFNAGFNIGYGCQVSDIARKESICEEWFKQFKKYKI
jgi:hypothetical protein